MRIRNLLAVPPLAAAAVIATVADAGSAPALRVITSEAASGSRVVVVAAGSASRPGGLALRVGSRPRQRVRGQWLVTCRRSGRSRTTRGTFDGRTTLRRTLRMGYAKPRRCRVSASAQLTARGRIRLTLLRR